MNNKSRFSHTLAVLCFVFMNAVSSPSLAEWLNLGLYGGQVYEIAIDPTNPSRMFAGTYYGGGLYVTDDGGSTWNEVLTGHEDKELDGEATFRNTAVWAVKIAPSNHNVIWATHNYWAEQSTDGGNTWTHVYNSAMQGSEFRYCRSLAIDPVSSNIVYVGTGGAYSTITGGTVYKRTVTRTGGVTWTKTGPNSNNEFPYTVVEVAVNPQNSNIVWALDSDESYYGHLYFSSDGGQTWSSYVVPVYSYIGETGLAVKPDQPNIVFIATYNGILRVVYPTNFNGAPSYGLISDATTNIRALAFSPSNPSILYAAGGETKLGRSTNGGSSFTWYETGTQTITIAVHPTTSNTIWTGDRLRGVHRGVLFISPLFTLWAWTSYNHGINAIKVNDFDVDPNDSNHLLAATMAGVYEKQGDAAWKSTAKLNYVEAFSVAFDPSDSSGASYYAGAEGYLYRTTNHGSSWTASSPHLSYAHYVNDIAVDPNSPSTLYITTRNPGGVYKSTNYGMNLSFIAPSTSRDFNAVAVNPDNSNNIFAGSGNFFSNSVLNGYIYESTNGGASWTPVLSNVIVNDLAFDPNNSNRVYAGCGHSSATDVPLYASTNGGTTWQKSYEGMPGEPVRYGIWGTNTGILYALRHTGSVVQGQENDKYISRYNGTWNEEYIGYSGTLYDIWGDNSLNIYAVGENGSILRSSGGAGWSAIKSGTGKDLYGVWGSSVPSRVVFVGESGTILSYNGTSWSSMNSNSTRDLYGVWGSSGGSRFFAVGSYGTILSYNGSGWTTMVSNAAVTFDDVWGTSEINVYAVGEATRIGSARYYTVYHYNGTSWSRMTTPSVSSGKSGRLRAIWGSSATDIWAAGDDGILLHYNGSGWGTPIPSGTTARLYDIWGNSSNNIYAAGQFGTILRFNGASWSSFAPDVNAIWNPVTDLAFAPDGNLYASTLRQGIYASANQAGNWTNLGAPPYQTYAVSSGSVYVGDQAGAYSLEGEGILYGVVSSAVTGTGLGDSKISTSIKSIPANDRGEWQMHHMGGVFNVSALHPGYVSQTRKNVPVMDAAFTRVDFRLASALPTPVVGNIPDQSVPAGGMFTDIVLDGYVTDPDNTDPEINWSVLGENDLSITIRNRIAAITMPRGWNRSESVTFQATDPQGYTGSDRVTFLVDSDGDGTADAFDTIVFPDDDRDGMPNLWEEYHGLDPLEDDADEDADGDGFSNLEEFRAATDPRNPYSRPGVRFNPGILLLLKN